jgi:hypothetical protein
MYYKKLLSAMKTDKINSNKSNIMQKNLKSYSPLLKPQFNKTQKLKIDKLDLELDSSNLRQIHYYVDLDGNIIGNRTSNIKENPLRLQHFYKKHVNILRNFRRLNSFK